MQRALNVQHITKKYHLKDELVVALKDFSYTFDYGKMYAIMGHSGSGKSTLIQCLGLIDNIDSGHIYIDDEDVKEMNDKKKDYLRNTKIGFIFQNYYLNNTMKAYENVILPMLINKKFQKVNLKKRAISLLKEVGLEDRTNHYPKELSGGEQQRVAIARALANEPKIILADEPTGNLDEENEIYILEKLSSLAQQGCCVIVVSHNPVVRTYADEVILLKHGQIVKGDN